MSLPSQLPYQGCDSCFPSPPQWQELPVSAVIVIILETEETQRVTAAGDLRRATGHPRSLAKHFQSRTMTGQLCFLGHSWAIFCHLVLAVYVATILIGFMSRMRDRNRSVTLRGAILALRWLVIYIYMYFLNLLFFSSRQGRSSNYL